MADNGGGWISKYGIPSVIASIAVFAFQQQQQTFDRLQSSVQDGYQFYSSGRTSLQYSDDADRELSLLKIIGNAFPNIYCDVREDIFERASAAQPSGGDAPDASGRSPIDSTDLSQLRQQLVAADRPARLQFPENLIQSYTQFGRGPGRQCPALNQPDASDMTASATPPAPAAPAAATGPAPEAPAASASATDAGPAVATIAPTRSAMVATAAPTAAPPQLTANPTLVRVFFHVPMSGARDASFAEAARADLAPYNYRVMRGVERAPPARFPDGPEVRYFDQNEEAAAQQLVTYLNWEFRAENLHFTPRALGARFPAMPRQTLEVWVPAPR